MSQSTLALAFALCVLVPAGAGSPIVTAQRSTTEGDLQIAYDFECNARHQYLVYAVTADREGFHRVACLFRALARAEQVHAERHAAVLRELGAGAESAVEPVVMRSTRSNLRSAIAEETYARDAMYRLFATQALQEECGSAAAVLLSTREAEGTHAALLRLALEHLDAMRIAQAFYVCPGCGSVWAEPVLVRCPGCGTPADRLERVI